MQRRLAVKQMDKNLRLSLIAEAVRYCQRVRSLGMPAACYSKSLREPVHFLWERRLGSKRTIAKFRSKSSLGISLGNGDLVYDHAIPFKYLQAELLQLEPINNDALEQILMRHCFAVWITKQEDRQLFEAGLGTRMPEGWDGEDPFARYKAVGIELVANDWP